jgi:hypothetical protein
VADRDEPEERFCTAEGWIGPNQEVYGRVGNPDCQFEDQDGNLLLTDPRTGEPICYEADAPAGTSPQVVGCDQPGARRPG